MFTPTKIAICLAVVLGTASGALAAPKHASHHGKHTVMHVSRTGVYGGYGAYGSLGTMGGELYMRPRIQTVSPTARCWGGSCSPDWRADDGS
jgi:hypothetical protein